MGRSMVSGGVGWVVCVALAVFAVPGVSSAGEEVLEVGSVRVVVESWSQGVRIVCDGVTVSVGSNMVVTEPPWAPPWRASDRSWK